MAIKLCTCTNEYQDKLYGKGMRVMNEKAGPNKGYCCTVCGTTKTG